jgi:hypothetical protein
MADISLADDSGGYEDFVIERPLSTNQLMQFESEINIQDFDKLRADWSHLPMLRLWSHGFNKVDLLSWFSSFPPELVSILERSLSIVHHALVSRISHLETFMCKLSTKAEPDAVDMEMLWCERAPLAALRVCYDPVTQARTGISINKVHAHLIQMHPEEYLARVAQHDMSFPMPAVDFLCMVLDDMLHISDDKMERYTRYSKNVNGERRAILMFTSKVRRYNSIGQVVAVIL